jgi:uncharacterized protein YjiS (DUF1127 family)
MKEKSIENPSGAGRWEDHVHSDSLDSRLRFATSMIGMAHWQLDGSPSHAGMEPVHSHWGVGFGEKLRQVFVALRKRIRLAVATRADIQTLSRLNEHLLRDIGLHHGHIVQLQTGMMSLTEIDDERRRQGRNGKSEETRVSPVAVIGHAGSWDCANDNTIRQAA